MLLLSSAAFFIINCFKKFCQEHYQRSRVSNSLDPDQDRHSVGPVSNSLDPDQDRHSVGPDLGPNCL